MILPQKIPMLSFFYRCVASASILACSSMAMAATPINKQECSFLWSVKARGLVAGETRDTVSWDTAGNVTVHSMFTPSGLAKTFGATVIERNWLASKGQRVVRDEIKYKSSGHDGVRWATKGNSLWKTTSAGEQTEIPSPGLGVRFIDSTVFPYLAMVGETLPAGESSAWVLSRGGAYQANVQSLPEASEYRAGNKHGTVWLSNKKPTRLTFSEGNESFEANVVGQQCQ